MHVHAFGRGACVCAYMRMLTYVLHACMHALAIQPLQVLEHVDICVSKWS